MQVVFDHVSTVYGDEGASVYDEPVVARAEPEQESVSIDEITESVVRRIRTDHNEPLFNKMHHSHDFRSISPGGEAPTAGSHLVWSRKRHEGLGEVFRSRVHGRDRIRHARLPLLARLDTASKPSAVPLSGAQAVG